MQETYLPHPGAVRESLALRRQVVKAISGIETSVRPDGKHPAADELKAFFDAASAFLTGFVVVDEPANSVLPSISGTKTVGSTLTAVDGTWSGSPTLTRQWLRNGVVIAGATAATYVLVAGDAGKQISVKVKAVNAGGTIYATSAETVEIAAA